MLSPDTRIARHPAGSNSRRAISRRAARNGDGVPSASTLVPRTRATGAAGNVGLAVEVTVRSVTDPRHAGHRAAGQQHHTHDRSEESTTYEPPMLPAPPPGRPESSPHPARLFGLRQRRVTRVVPSSRSATRRSAVAWPARIGARQRRTARSRAGRRDTSGPSTLAKRANDPYGYVRSNATLRFCPDLHRASSRAWGWWSACSRPSPAPPYGQQPRSVPAAPPYPGGSGSSVRAGRPTRDCVGNHDRRAGWSRCPRRSTSRVVSSRRICARGSRPHPKPMRLRSPRALASSSPPLSTSETAPATR